jgi:hypothetical protein
MRVERVPVVDEYVEDGESVLLLPDGQVVALSALATAALAVLSDGRAADETEVARALVEEFGPPPGDPDGMETIPQVLAALVEAGVVVDST